MLPKLNDTPKYEMTIPSLGLPVKYRPYLVKEEKVLLMAQETQDNQEIIRSVVDTVSSCIESDIDMDTLSTFDVDYMFTQIRMKSVGETAEMIFNCHSCGEGNLHVVPLAEAKLDGEMPETSDVELTDDVTVIMRYPSYTKMAGGDQIETAEDLAMMIIKASMYAVRTSSDYIIVDEVPAEELDAFVGSLTSQQFAKLGEWVGTAPRLVYDSKFKCKECGEENRVVLEGLQSFF